MITDAAETLLQHKLHPELCSVHPDQPFSWSEKAYMLARDVALQQWIDEFLRVQRRTGELHAAIQHWLG
jgi:cyclohexadienyl dehydratase